MRQIIILLVFFNSSFAIATVQIAGPADFRNILSGLEAGDTLYLSPGNYTQSLRIENLLGSTQQPILIAGQPGLAKPVFLGNACCNTVSLKLSAYIYLKDIICNGQNIVGIDAIKAEGGSNGWTHHIVVEGFEINNYGADQQNVGVSTKCPSWDWWVHHNVITGAGTGMYFGDSDGEQPFANSLIEYNLVQNTVGYNCQVKHQNLNTRNLTIGMPASGKTTIRYNVFSKAQNASSGSSARPNLLVGNFPASGNGANDYYEIYGNIFFQNPFEALFQGTGNLGFYDNLLYNSVGGAGISIQSHNGFQPRDIDVFFNTILVSGGSGISFSGVNTSYLQRAWANAVFSPTAISGGQQTENITGTFAQASQFLNAPSLPITSMDLTPQITMLDIAGINLAVLAKYADYDSDFDGVMRDGTRAGAYQNNSPLWPLQLGIRSEIQTGMVSPNTEIFLNNSAIFLYPCPAQNYVQIEGALSDYQIKILDVNGATHQVINATGSLTTIDIQALPAGIFFVSILNANNGNLSMIMMIKAG